MDLVLDTLEQEIAPHLDLPSTLSLSFTSKYFHKILNSEPNPSKLQKHLASHVEIHPVMKIFDVCAEQGYYDLFKEFLLTFLNAVRSFPNYSHLEFFQTILRTGNFELFEFARANIRRRLAPHSLLFVGCGESGSVPLVQKLLSTYDLDLKDEPVWGTMLGAARKGHMNILHWLVTETTQADMAMSVLECINEAAGEGNPTMHWDKVATTQLLYSQ